MLMINDDEATNTKKVLSKRKSSNSYKLTLVTGSLLTATYSYSSECHVLCAVFTSILFIMKNKSIEKRRNNTGTLQ